MPNKSISIAQTILPGFYEAWYSNTINARYRVIFGARNTGKSVNIGGYEAIDKIISDKRRNIVFVRKDDSSNDQSTYANIKRIIFDLGIQDYFEIRRSPKKIIYRPTGQCIYFSGFNNPERLLSIKSDVGEITDIYFEEASELTNYEEFRKLDGSLRAPDGIPLQMTFMLNPWDIGCMIYEHFVKGNYEDRLSYLENHDYDSKFIPEFTLGYGKGLYIHQSTYKVNKFRASYYDENAEMMKIKAPEIYKVEFLGMWGNTADSVYEEFTDGCICDATWVEQQSYAYYALGIDFGVSDGQGHIQKNEEAILSSANTMQLIGITSDLSRIVVIDEYFYSNEGSMTHKSGPAIQQEMIETIMKWREKYLRNPTLMKGRIPVYVDCADSGGFRDGLDIKSRQALLPCVFQPSTKIPIRSRIDFTRLLCAYGDFIVSRACPNLIREMKNCKKGEKGKAREDINDHAINACEYAWAPYRKDIVKWKTFKEHN